MKDFNYEIIIPPTPFDFWKRSNEELKKYYQWYMEIIDKRIDQLAQYVKKTEGFESWDSYHDPLSLEGLGKWFLGNVETRKRSEKEKNEIYSIASELLKQVEIQNWELTNKTFSLSIDIGMYMAKVFLKNNQNLYWFHHIKGRKDDINYGHPVILGFKKNMEFNPTHMMVTLAYGIADNTYNEKRMKDIYDIWIKMYY